MKILFNTTFYVASKRLAFKNFPGLLDLQGWNGVDKKRKKFVPSTALVERQRKCR